MLDLGRLLDPQILQHFEQNFAIYFPTFVSIAAVGLIIWFEFVTFRTSRTSMTRITKLEDEFRSFKLTVINQLTTQIQYLKHLNSQVESLTHFYGDLDRLERDLHSILTEISAILESCSNVQLAMLDIASENSKLLRDRRNQLLEIKAKLEEIQNEIGKLIEQVKKRNE